MNYTTTDLKDFGYYELKETARLIQAKIDWGFPDDFYEDEVTIMMNKKSGNVFFTNSNFQVAMMNGDTLESFYYCYECGHEGFKEDCDLNENGCNECNPR